MRFLNVLAAGLLAATSGAVPVEDATACPASNITLPSTYPKPSKPCSATVPTHFGLFGYSFDGTIVHDNYNAAYLFSDMSSVSKPPYYTGSRNGSYAFGIGPAGHMFSMDNGFIGEYSIDSGAGRTHIFFTMMSWHYYWDELNDYDRQSTLLPICNVEPYWNVLQCSQDGVPLEFGYCKGDAPLGDGYDPYTVTWGTAPSPCTKIVIRVEQVPKGWQGQKE